MFSPLTTTLLIALLSVVTAPSAAATQPPGWMNVSYFSRATFAADFHLFGWDVADGSGKPFTCPRHFRSDLLTVREVVATCESGFNQALASTMFGVNLVKAFEENFDYYLPLYQERCNAEAAIRANEGSANDGYRTFNWQCRPRAFRPADLLYSFTCDAGRPLRLDLYVPRETITSAPPRGNPYPLQPCLCQGWVAREGEVIAADPAANPFAVQTVQGHRQPVPKLPPSRRHHHSK